MYNIYSMKALLLTLLLSIGGIRAGAQYAEFALTGVTTCPWNPQLKKYDNCSNQAGGSKIYIRPEYREFVHREIIPGQTRRYYILSSEVDRGKDQTIYHLFDSSSQNYSTFIFDLNHSEITTIDSTDKNNLLIYHIGRAVKAKSMYSKQFQR